MNENEIAILGGTGDQGLGLALRFTKAGRPVVIGSRKLERAVAAANKVREAGSGADVEGLANEDACTSILVSAGASTDGSVMITYSADAPFLPRLLHVPGGTHAADDYESAGKAALIGGTTTLIEMCCPSREDDPIEAFAAEAPPGEG